MSGLFDVAGRSVVVTGATGALGRAASLALSSVGAKVTLAAGSAKDLDAVAEEISARGGSCVTVPRRPETLADAEAISAAAVEAFGRIDGLVVASGTNLPKMIGDMATEEWEQVMDANVRGSWLMCKSVGARMIAQGEGGKVVLVSSVRGRLGTARGYSAYCPSKSAVDGLTRSLACEWGPHKINVNAIGPTVFRSKLTEWMFREDEKGSASRIQSLPRIPLGRLGEPEDLAGILIYLMAPASDFCTGQVIYVDGGYTAG
ncbi:MAG: SDR family oxidoreductase [Rhodopseudomonas sp.]|nr:SDR family oxidoreductase [Rhodopseudomonas sp.]